MPTILSSTSRANACVIHCRVSTQKQAYEGESLDTQASICTAIAKDKGWAVAHVPWKESFSGRKSKRPVFREILTFIDQNPGRVRYYLFRSIDRLTRGGTSSYDTMKSELARRGVEMVDCQGVIQPIRNTLADVGFEYDWSMKSPSEIAEAVVATSANHEVTTILTRLVGQSIRLRQAGYKVRQPADGYVNARISLEGRKRFIEQPDPERAKYFIAMFEMRANGQYTDAEICERLNAMGYRSRMTNRWDATHTTIIGTKGGNPLTPKRLQEAIRRPIYCGVIYEKWTHWQPIKAAYAGLVSVELFNAANRGAMRIYTNADGDLEIAYGQSSERSVRRYTKHSPLFPFRKVVVCPRCRQPFYGSSPRGSTGKRFPIYHCSRNHEYFGVKKAAFDKAVINFVEGLRFNPELLMSLEAVIVHCYQAHQQDVADAVRHVEDQIAMLELQKAQAVRAFMATTSEVVRRSVEAEAERYEREIEAARAVHDNVEVSESDLSGYIRAVKKILELPSELLKEPTNTLEQQALYSLVFPHPPTYDEMHFGTAKLDWIFYLSSDFEGSKPASVHLRSLDWNLIEQSILRWKSSCLGTSAHESSDGHDAYATTSPKSPHPPSS